MQDKEPILFESQYRCGRQYFQGLYRMYVPISYGFLCPLGYEALFLVMIVITLLRGQRPSNELIVFALALPPTLLILLFSFLDRKIANSAQTNRMLYGEAEPLVLLQVTESGIRSIVAGAEGGPFISFCHIRNTYRRGQYLYFRLADDSFIAANFGNITIGNEAELLAFLHRKGVCGL